MGFMQGIGKGFTNAITGGDQKMDLADYLKLASMAVSVGTGNVPGVIALGSSYAGDATGNEYLKTAGDIGGMVAGGLGAANALSSGAGAAQSAAGAAEQGTQALTQGAADAATTGASTLPEIAKAAEAANSPMIQGAPFADYMGTPGGDTVAQALGGQGFGAQNPGFFKKALSDVLGETAQERWDTVGDVAATAADVASQMQAQPTVPELPNIGVQEFDPSGLSVRDFLLASQQGGYRSPYAGVYGGRYGG